MTMKYGSSRLARWKIVFRILPIKLLHQQNFPSLQVTGSSFPGTFVCGSQKQPVVYTANILSWPELQFLSWPSVEQSQHAQIIVALCWLSNSLVYSVSLARLWSNSWYSLKTYEFTLSISHAHTQIRTQTNMHKLICTVVDWV